MRLDSRFCVLCGESGARRAIGQPRSHIASIQAARIGRAAAAAMAAPDGGAFRLLVCAPMPLGTSWTRAETEVPHGFRVYTSASVETSARSSSPTPLEARRNGRSKRRLARLRGNERTTEARKVLASGRPLRPPSARRAPRRRPPSMHSSLRLASPKGHRGDVGD